LNSQEKRRLLILDANILIDFCKCDKTILKLISDYVGEIYLATTVFEEIKEIDENDCAQLGIILVEPELEQAMKAAEKRGPLSFEDHLSLVLAKENGWICVTNDKPLRSECSKEGVPLIWGIELICILVEENGLQKDDAKSLILQIQKINPRYITDSIVERAFRRLGFRKW
jgi:rRNA-processing protein FCF1